MDPTILRNFVFRINIHSRVAAGTSIIKLRVGGKYINGLVQDCSDFIANALELLWSGPKAIDSFYCGQLLTGLPISFRITATLKNVGKWIRWIY